MDGHLGEPSTCFPQDKLLKRVRLAVCLFFAIENPGLTTDNEPDFATAVEVAGS